ncbi:MAG TPA: hypothetical protein VFO25_10035 [Candidatus Eremiobacteraceae bacterium]|nr:hypothetical protein [Candidatus Eremiobacteraceae bacterium]
MPRAIRISAAAVWLLAIVALAPRYAAARTAVDVPGIEPGTSTPIVFVDTLQQSTPWSSTSPLALSPEGDVLALRPGQVASRIVFAPGQAHVAGDYVLLYAGRGRFAFEGGRVIAMRSGRIVIRVGPSNSGLAVALVNVDAQDPPHDLHLILPGFENSFARRPFYPAFVASMTGADTLRFATWSHASALVSSQVWPLRPRVGDVTQARDRGVAWEYQIELADETGADPWFVIPVGATNAYVAGMSDLVHRFIDPRLRPSFEYGDGVLTVGSPANAYAQMAARNTGLARDAGDAASRWYSVRSNQIESIVARVFGADAGRVGFMIASQDGSRGDSTGTTWRKIGDSTWMNGDASTHARIVPSVASFAVGSDTAPAPDRPGPPPQALHFTPLLSPGSLSPRVDGSHEVASAIGDPLQLADLTAEGTTDWIAVSAPGRFERKAHGGQLGIRFEGSQVRGTSPGFAALAWRDGVGVRSGSSSAGIAFTGSTIAHVSAPASRGSNVLRLYFGLSSATATFDVTLAGASISRRTVSTPRGSHEYVYTLVYHSSTTSRIDVTLSMTNPSHGDVAFYGATLTPLPANLSLASSDMTTYHGGPFRLGWDMGETQLNTTNVASQFGLLETLAVDGSVLAQPLYLEHFAPLGGRNILIVATEHASIYEFDADTGQQINKVHFGTSQSSHDVGCLDIRPEYGITGTPVIDPTSQTLYVVVATEPSLDHFKTRLHALDIATLADKIAPVDITASETISNGMQITFDPQHQMNRSSLVLANGSVYVPIGSHCDNNAGAITGWVLRYDFNLNQIGKFATDEDSTTYLLSSVWMTGFAPAVDTDGSLFAVTGNGAFDIDQGGKNYGESVIRLSADLTADLDYFTPDDWQTLNDGDTDFGSGGIMLLPAQQGSVPNVAVAQGKESTLYLLNRAALGGVQNGDAGALQHITGTGGGVWGGPAYYSGPTGQFVYYQAGGAPLSAYAVEQGQNGVPKLELSSTGSSYSGYGGSMPVVSSFLQKPGTGIVWLINRSSPLKLEAYDATDVSKMLFSAAAGIWSNPQSNGFLTPLVADGKVFVPASGTVTVFGIGGKRLPIAQTNASGPVTHQVHGVVVSATSATLHLRLRDGRIVSIDLRQAAAARTTGMLPVDKAVVVYGTIDKLGVFHATSVGHTSQNPKDWTPDN